MARSRDTEDGFWTLLADVMANDQEDVELLVRYADDPASLSPEERQVLDRASQNLRRH